MDDNTRELTNHLFAAVTALLEDATLVAVAGQSPMATPARLAGLARRLEVAAQDIGAVAAAIAVATRARTTRDRRTLRKHL